MIDIHAALPTDSSMILRVHDELLFEVHKNEVDVIAPLIVKEMESAIQINVPIIVDWNYGVNWFEAH